MISVRKEPTKKEGFVEKRAVFSANVIKDCLLFIVIVLDIRENFCLLNEIFWNKIDKVEEI